MFQKDLDLWVTNQNVLFLILEGHDCILKIVC